MARDDLDRFKKEHGEFVDKINRLRHENIEPREESSDLTKELRDLIELCISQHCQMMFSKEK